MADPKMLAALLRAMPDQGQTSTPALPWPIGSPHAPLPNFGKVSQGMQGGFFQSDMPPLSREGPVEMSRRIGDGWDRIIQRLADPAYRSHPHDGR